MPLSAADLHAPILNHLYLYGEITLNQIQRLRKEIERIEASSSMSIDGITVYSKPNPVLLHINSFGGNLSAGISGIRLLRTSKVPVYTIVDGVAMSAAATIFAAGLRRYAYPNSMILIHQHWSGSDEKANRHEDSVADSRLSTATYEQYRRFYLEVSKMDGATLDGLLARDKILSANESKKLGLLDEIISAVSTSVLKSLSKNTFEKITPSDLNAAVKLTQSKRHVLDVNKRLNDIKIPDDDEGDDDDDDDSSSTNSKDHCLSIVKGISLLNRMSTSQLVIVPDNDESSSKGSFSYSGIPRPIKLHIPEFLPFDDEDDYFALIPLSGAIGASLLPIVSIIDGNCETQGVLLSLMCHERWVSKYSILHFDFRYLHTKSPKHVDAVVNTKTIKEFIQKLFKTKTKLPTEISSALFTKSHVVNSTQALEYGIADGCLDDNASLSPRRSIVTSSIST